MIVISLEMSDEPKIYSMIIGLNKNNVVPVTDSVVSRY